jgi:small-conductance mechanosensitive channel
LTEANHELIVANKTLLDEQVKNLTLSDQFVQMTVTIDVDRNLPVAETKRKMLELTFSHPMVIKTNRPVVLLTEVDGYALRFQVHFWIEHRSFMKSAIVQSEVLEMITAEFPSADGEPPIALAQPATDEVADVETEPAEQTKGASESGSSGSADRSPSPGVQKGQSAAATGRPAGVDRGIATDIRKMSRAAVKKEIRRGLR